MPNQMTVISIGIIVIYIAWNSLATATKNEKKIMNPYDDLCPPQYHYIFSIMLLTGNYSLPKRGKGHPCIKIMTRCGPFNFAKCTRVGSTSSDPVLRCYRIFTGMLGYLTPSVNHFENFVYAFLQGCCISQICCQMTNEMGTPTNVEPEMGIKGQRWKVPRPRLPSFQMGCLTSWCLQWRWRWR